MYSPLSPRCLPSIMSTNGCKPPNISLLVYLFQVLIRRYVGPVFASVVLQGNQLSHTGHSKADHHQLAQEQSRGPTITTNFVAPSRLQLQSSVQDMGRDGCIRGRGCITLPSGSTIPRWRLVSLHFISFDRLPFTFPSTLQSYGPIGGRTFGRAVKSASAASYHNTDRA